MNGSRFGGGRRDGRGRRTASEDPALAAVFYVRQGAAGESPHVPMPMPNAKARTLAPIIESRATPDGVVCEGGFVAAM